MNGYSMMLASDATHSESTRGYPSQVWRLLSILRSIVERWLDRNEEADEEMNGKQELKTMMRFIQYIVLADCNGTGNQLGRGVLLG